MMPPLTSPSSSPSFRVRGLHLSCLNSPPGLRPWPCCPQPSRPICRPLPLTGPLTPGRVSEFPFSPFFLHWLTRFGTGPSSLLCWSLDSANSPQTNGPFLQGEACKSVFSPTRKFVDFRKWPLLGAKKVKAEVTRQQGAEEVNGTCGKSRGAWAHGCNSTSPAKSQGKKNVCVNH